MKTNLFVCFCAFFLFCTDAKSEEKFPFKEAQGSVSKTPGQSWSDFKVGGFKLQWNGSNGRVNFFHIQHFQFCVVPAEKMKFEAIADPTQFLYRSLDLRAPINQSSKEPSKRASRFPTSPMVPVPNGSTLMLKHYDKYLALSPSGAMPKSLAYEAKLWQKMAVEKNAGELEVTTDESTGIRTAKIAPMEEFYIPEIGKILVFKWNTKPRLGGAEPGEYDGWVTLDFEVHTKSIKMWEGMVNEKKAMSLSDIENPFSTKLERVTSSSGVVNIGLSFPPPPPHAPAFVRLIKLGDKCVGIELASVSDKEIVFRWKTFSGGEDKVAQRVTQNR